MKSNNNYSQNNNKKLDNKEISALKKILSPIVLEVIGKKYTDIYIKKLGDKYYELIENLTKKKKISSFSEEGTKLNSDDNIISMKNSDLNNKTNLNKKKSYSTYWMDYGFVNNSLIDKKINNVNDNSLFVQISQNKKSFEEEQSESIIIKNENEENEENEDEDN